MRLRRGTLLLVVVWVAGALLATTVGVLAVRRVRADVGDPASQPLSASDVQRAVAGTTTSPRPRATPTKQTATAPAPTPSPAPAVARRTFQTAGGSVAVQCSGSVPSLVYVLPASGWAVDEREVQPDRVAVKFRSGEREAEVKVACSAAGVPVNRED
jgi:hypothetical protein